MTLLRGLHSIAAQRGEGLRPGLLGMMTPSPAWSGLERTGSTASVGDTDVNAADMMQGYARSAKVAILRRRERG